VEHLLDLKDDGLITFDDPMAEIDQISDVDRLGMAGLLRLTASGRDRARTLAAPPLSAPAAPNIQLVFAEQAQVAARDINNTYNTYDEMLDRVAEALAQMSDISEEDRVAAKTMLERLRGKADSVATSAAGSAGGAVLGALFKQILGLP
jgi:hypothetical protein